MEVKSVPEQTWQGAMWNDILSKVEIQYPDLTRKSINQLASEGVYDVPSLIAVVARTNNENNRETALKRLGEVGGDFAVTTLELTLVDRRGDRWIAKKAAANALRKEGLLNNDGNPIFNPVSLTKEFVRLEVVYRGRGVGVGHKTSKVNSFDKVASLKIAKPEKVQSIALTLKAKFDKEAIIAKATIAGLVASEKKSGAVHVSGGNWPGFGDKGAHLSLELFSNKRGTLTVKSAALDLDLAMSRWSSAVRVLARMSKWLLD